MCLWFHIPVVNVSGTVSVVASCQSLVLWPKDGKDALPLLPLERHLLCYRVTAVSNYYCGDLTSFSRKLDEIEQYTAAFLSV